MRDNKSLLLALLAAGLIVTWVYHLYDKNQYSNQTREIFVKDTAAVAQAVSDSLRKIYSQMLDQLGVEKIQIDSSYNLPKEEYEQKIFEINKLHLEIGDILKRKALTPGDFNEARTKINDLQEKIIEFKAEDTLLATRLKKPNETFSTQNGEGNALHQTTQKPRTASKEIVQKINDVPVFKASQIKFAAYSVRSDQKETETTEQNKAYKFVSSFIVKNSTADVKNAEIIIVISDPSGKSLNTEVWDAGSFETKVEGKKIYTRKVKFEYNKGEAKHLIFSLEPDSFEKGTYKLSLYHNGIRIGGSSWKLS